jgi:hypothetical protein
MADEITLKHPERRRLDRAAEVDEEEEEEDEAGRRGPDEGEAGVDLFLDSALLDHHPARLFFGVLEVELSEDDVVRIALLNDEL